MKQNRYLYAVRVIYEDFENIPWDEEFERNELRSCFRYRSSASHLARWLSRDFLSELFSSARVRFEVWRISYVKSKFESDRQYTLLEVWRNYPSEF